MLQSRPNLKPITEILQFFTKIFAFRQITRPRRKAINVLIAARFSAKRAFYGSTL